ncbi:MAG TPA: MFS transporter [Phycisphaerae bacterium]|nr:MFS transporter [Phycisphaerae bacterium]HOB75246.1 MFS transporter [Phycisphaerae bacterium]HOJ55078.1 MFS transporter [Phycisphaerae bacterium]HOL24920.1 MFS transporter [Phycisphaerae bacterium]HPP23142.1 MFS transporter [Phycisphaerae bacterium]
MTRTKSDSPTSDTTKETAVAGVAGATDAVAESPGLLGRFLVLRGAMPELWITFAIKFFGVIAYSIVNSTIVLWLSKDLGFLDESASWIVAAWSLSMTIFTLLVGSLTDAIGMRKAFLLGIVICILARAVMTFTTFPLLAIFAGLLPLAIGEALGTPVMIAATRRYSTTAQRSISFSIIYVVMNLGFLVKGKIFDWVRHPEFGMGEDGLLTLPLLGELTTYRMLFLISLLFELILLPLVYFGIREGAEATDEGVKFTPSGSSHAGQAKPSVSQVIADAARDTIRVFIELGRRPGFYRMLGFLVMIAFLKLLFVTMSYVFPKFGIRELGPGAPIGTLWDSTNAALIVVLVPIIGALSQKISAYRMVAAGGIVTAASMFIMVLPPEWFKPLADGWLGKALSHPWYLGLSGEVNPWYVMIFFYVVALSIGEAIYSPRVYEYAASIAPRGQEASYGALSYVPYFVAKLLVGAFGGMLLARYCPETGPRNPQMMWLVLALGTMIAPIGLIVLRRWIRVQEAGRED